MQKIGSFKQGTINSFIIKGCKVVGSQIMSALKEVNLASVNSFLKCDILLNTEGLVAKELAPLKTNIVLEK